MPGNPIELGWIPAVGGLLRGSRWDWGGGGHGAKGTWEVEMGQGVFGMQGMSNRAWVGAEGEQVGQGGACKSFPTLRYAIMKMSYAITKKKVAFLEAREERQAGCPRGGGGCSGQGELGTNSAPCRTANRG